MEVDFDEILAELSFRVPEGIVDLSKANHVAELANILREYNVPDANQFAQKARVYFSYLNEATVSAKDTAHKMGLVGKGGTAYGPKGSDTITHRNIKGQLKKVSSQPKATQKKKLGPADYLKPAEKRKKAVAPTADKPSKKSTDGQNTDVNESPIYDKNNEHQRAIAEAKNPEELREALINLQSIEEQKMFKNKIAGMGGLVASAGESMYVGISSDLIHGTSDVTNSKKYKTQLAARQKNTQRILASGKSREFNKLAGEFDAIAISQKLDLTNSNDYKSAIQIYNERESFVTVYDAEFKKTKTGKDSKFKKEESRHSWISAAYMGSLSLVKNGPKNWDRKAGNGTLLKANAVTQGATEELLNNRLKAAETPEETEHYKRELEMWNEFKGYHDTYLVYTNDKGYTEVFSISNKKSRDLNDPQNNTTPAARLKNYLKMAEERGVPPKIVVKLAKAEQRAQKGAENMNAVAMAGFDEINKRDVKSIAYIGQRLVAGKGAIKSKDDVSDKYLTALSGDRYIKAAADADKKDKNNITPAQTVQYALQVWNDPDTDQSKLSGNYSKFILKLGTLAQTIYTQSKSMTPKEISDSMGGAYSTKDIKNMLNPTTSLGKTMAALRDIKTAHAEGLNGVHVGFMNDLHKADGTKPGHTGSNGPAVQTYVAGTLHSLHIDTYVKNYDDKVLVEMGGVGVTPRDMRGCMAKLSGYTGKTDTPKERNVLKEHLIKSVKIDASSGEVFLVGNNKNHLRIASDTWRQAGANTKKVATAYGPELQKCLKGSVKNRK